MSCFAGTEFEKEDRADEENADEERGFPILFVDGHATFATHQQLTWTVPAGYGDYILDWASNGLKGEDVR
jgi:prepilin-type processing-associated H-X9-DG protein